MRSLGSTIALTLIAAVGAIGLAALITKRKKA